MKLSFINMSFLIVIILSMIIDLLPEKIFYFPADLIFFILVNLSTSYRDTQYIGWGEWRK